MLQVTLFLLLIGYSSANFCTDDTGEWISSVADGVTDYAHGGTRLNTKYYCFEGCLNTGTVLQNYKVDLSGNNGTTVKIERVRAAKDIVSLVANDDEDPNARSCVDPVLRQDVKAALQKATQNTCKNIVNTLVLNLNRPGWAITCIRYNDQAIDDYISDMNFCSYDGGEYHDVFTVRLAKLDMS
ncbi:Protein CBG02858 [Caenorhabditis briggsae]|uniref:Uncharacterized protein n=2 Tax=Caenorhabditis briggsae TaxID=6238 RepID=A0AAE9DKT6_CAEBR|nr:Protein CBG02858 [Caenorhabditis briggsae]ULU06211.1 hypothetical protein L3Y34_018230 [Caenorhabditis briggsae]CAP23741.2 Protein CBG02858 [Caenorhabditis briggsae]